MNLGGEESWHFWEKNPSILEFCYLISYVL